MDKQVKECRSAPFAAPKIWRGAPRSRSKFAGVTERRSSSWSGYPSLAATLRLSGSALLWLRAQRTGNVIYGHGEGKKDYAQFKRDFLARFRPLDDPLRSTEAMKDLHMMDGETINEFKDRVMIAIEKKNYTYDDKTTDAYKTVRDTDAYRSITIGMTGQLRRCLMSGSDPPKELETLMKQAVQAEAALRKTAAIPGMAGIMEVTGEQDPDPQPAEGNGSESADAAGVNGSVQEMINELAKIKKQFQCYGCKEYGHLRRDCPNVNKQQPQPPQQPQPGAGVREEAGYLVEVEDGTRGAATLEGGIVRHQTGAVMDSALRRQIGKTTLGVGSSQGDIFEEGRVTECRHPGYMRCTNKMNGNQPVEEE